MHLIIRTLVVTAAVSGATGLLPGCGQQRGAANSALPIANDTAGFAASPSTQHNTWSSNQPRVVVVLNVEHVSGQGLRLVTKPAAPGETGESVVDLASPNGLPNYINAQFPHDLVRRVVVQNADGQVLRDATVSSRGEVSTSVNASAATFALGQHIQVPPPGVSIDHAIRPVAPVTAPRRTKRTRWSPSHPTAKGHRTSGVTTRTGAKLALTAATSSPTCTTTPLAIR
ncbi:hypothetical protein [Alicyclobacillus fastidiosus]|uniref:hypothetical protein n=1 Tax=Alicyclobacillus fastidiosus TaxID=392011 RepID=UPI0023E99FD7|nr:hypothetical protein [Alicyclobacillus fastidiosus]GMA63555.1 hypothetical protein GCM10025859_39950 [Alicyclobacillus fastidiosus]